MNNDKFSELKKNSQILKDLNESQMESVTSTDGYVRVIAGAGSGKTKALTSRFSFLVECFGVMPSNILCVTFTNKAAYEMKKRIRFMIGDNDLGKITTFHGFCVQILREEHNTIQFPSNFLILDEVDTKSIIAECFTKLNISGKDLTHKKAIECISSRKNNTTTEYIDFLCDGEHNALNKKRESATSIEDKIFYEFLYFQRKMFGLDFDDLIIIALDLLIKNDKIRIKWQERLQYIMVDEFQDVSSRQYQLVTILSSYHKNLFVVGDPDQTIYSWRGADVNNILKFAENFENVRTITMNENYRSFQEIINTSNTLIQKNRNRFDKSLVSVRKGQGKCIYFHGKTSQEEAKWIGTQIKSLLKQGAKHSDIAILYRSHFVTRAVEEQLVADGIPYLLYSGTAFYKRKEIKDVISYLRMVVQADDISFLRVINEPRRGIGKKRIEILKKYAEENHCTLYQALEKNEDNPKISKKTVSDFLRTIEHFQQNYKKMSLSDLVLEVLNHSKYEDYLRTSGEDERLDNLSTLKQSICDFETSDLENISLDDYLEHISLFTSLDQAEKEEAVKLMTVHTSKGLEFPYVFVISLSEGVFPSIKTNTKEQLEEERRLAYVAFTRAEEKLFLTDSEGKTIDGGYRYPSRFIFNCEKVNLDYVVELPEHLVEAATLEINRNEKMLNVVHKNFIKGDRVKHILFEEGIIVDVCEKEGYYIIKFDDCETVRNLKLNSDLIKIQNL